jgi:hypothetical protein
MKNIFALLIAIISFASCGGEKKEEKKSVEKKKTEEHIYEGGIQLKDLYFMEGNWVDASGSMPGFNERWVKQGDTLIQVIGFFVNGKDTAIMEAIKVKSIHGTIHYIPKIENQNNGAEIPYELQNKSTKDSLVFANYGHDFPQEIIYVKKSSDSVLVYLKGIGEYKKPLEYRLQLKKSDGGIADSR